MYVFFFFKLYNQVSFAGNYFSYPLILKYFKCVPILFWLWKCLTTNKENKISNLIATIQCNIVHSSVQYTLHIKWSFPFTEEIINGKLHFLCSEIATSGTHDTTWDERYKTCLWKQKTMIVQENYAIINQYTQKFTIIVCVSLFWNWYLGLYYFLRQTDIISRKVNWNVVIWIIHTESVFTGWKYVNLF